MTQHQWLKSKGFEVERDEWVRGEIHVQHLGPKWWRARLYGDPRTWCDAETPRFALRALRARLHDIAVEWRAEAAKLEAMEVPQ